MIERRIELIERNEMKWIIEMKTNEKWFLATWLIQLNWRGTHDWGTHDDIGFK